MKTQWLKFHSSQVCFNCKSQFVYTTDNHECDAKNVSESKLVCNDCFCKLVSGSMSWADMYRGAK